MKLKKQILTFLMTLVMIVSLVACGGGEGGKNPAGVYNLTKMGSGAEEITVEEMVEIAGMDIGMTLELKEDNSFVLNMGLFADEGEDSVSGTWKMDGDSLILSAEGDDISVTYDDSTIVMDMEGEFLTFEKP